MINISAINTAKRLTEPYPHAVIHKLLSKADIYNLLKTLPEKTFKLVKRNAGSDKTYKVFNSIIHPLKEQKPLADLPAVWESLVLFLTSQVYKNALSKLIDYDLSKTLVEITLKRYGKGHFISPHTDRSMVPATHVIFLNPEWEASWGGEFCLYYTNKTLAYNILPTWDQSVLFKQSEASWHAVNPCLSSIHSRVGLQVAFWLGTCKLTLSGREECDLVY